MSKTKSFALLFTMFFFAACGNSDGKQSQDSAIIEDLTETELNDPAVPVEAQTFDVNVKLIGFNEAQEEKIYEAVELIKKVIASEEFKSKVLAKQYNGERTYVDNGGLSNSQIYKRILGGAERVGNTLKNNTMDLDLQVYYEVSPTIGYTYPNTTRIFMNSKFLNKHDPWQVTDNLMHEWLHKLGFKHAVERTDGRAHSVPYSIGYLMRDLAQKFSSP